MLVAESIWSHLANLLFMPPTQHLEVVASEAGTIKELHQILDELADTAHELNCYPNKKTKRSAVKKEIYRKGWVKK